MENIKMKADNRALFELRRQFGKIEDTDTKSAVQIAAKSYAKISEEIEKLEYTKKYPPLKDNDNEIITIEDVEGAPTLLVDEGEGR